MQRPLFTMRIGKTLCLTAVLACLNPIQADAEEYRYDDFGRLIEVIFDNGKRIVYVYDNAGNRVEENHIEPPPTTQQ